MLIVAPLTLLSRLGGSSPQITLPSSGIPAGLVPVFNEATRVYAVNAYLLASIADQESTFGTGPGWRTVNSAGCIGLMQMCVGGAGGDSWDATRTPTARPTAAALSFMTTRHPDVLDSFDNVMAAAVHLRGKVGGRPIPRLDGLAYQALCGYYGACSDGLAGNYAADVLARARNWEREAPYRIGADPGARPERRTGVAGPRPGHGPVLRAPHMGGVPPRRRHRRPERHADPRRGRRPRLGGQSSASSGGYGNFTCLQHTGALSSCYAHQAALPRPRWSDRRAGPADRHLRLHRPLLRTPPALRGPHQQSARLPRSVLRHPLRLDVRPGVARLMSPRIRTHGLVVLLLVSLAGCQDPYARGRAPSTHEAAQRRAAPTDSARPGPSAAPLSSWSAPPPTSSRRVARSFAERWTNWDWEHAARQQRALARLATGALVRQLLANAASARIDATLARDKPGSRGTVVTIALRATNVQATGIVVTHEQALTDGRADLGGRRYRVYAIRLRRAPRGWGVSAWQPQP